MTLYPSVLELIGNTPLVDISSLSPNPSARLFIKLEGQNPGGSVKDRVALSLIEQAERDGLLVPGQARSDPHGALVGQHRHRPGPGVPGQGLPPQGGDADQRLHRAAPAPRAVGGRDH